MIILFEEYPYKTDFLKKHLNNKYFFAVDSQRSKIDYVGYYFDSDANNGNGDAVIILPKVFFNEKQKVFNDYSPEEIAISFQLESSINEKVKNTLFEISTWLFRSIQQFRKRHSYSTITDSNQVNEVISNFEQNSSTELDIVLSLLKFYKKNNSLFILISKNSNSQLHKVNWNKTVNKQQPIFKNNQPVYLTVNSTKKRINDEEELLVLFYSTLNYLKLKYSFEFTLPQHYKLIVRQEFEKLLRSGTRYLRKIKYKYYSDKLIELYNLLFVFFDKSNSVKAKNRIEEVLLVKDFNIVFEDMIDDLIGDQNLMPELKNQVDGKQVDHIYKYESLILDDNIYYVGDSKYYKNTTAIGQYSQAKQFTYAKNVIQYSIDLFNKKVLPKDIQYRDDLTEGYNITPNFFITAFVDDALEFKKSNLKDNEETILKFHYENRLFDRDTLFVQSYNINFLFVLSAYVSKNTTIKSQFKNDTQKLFREKLLFFIKSNYKIFIVLPSCKIDDFINKHFKLLNGKMYKPSQFTNKILIAFDKKHNYDSIINEINDSCESIQEYEME